MLIYLVLGLVIGALLGLLAGFLWATQREKAVQRSLENERSTLQQKLDELSNSWQGLQIERERLQTELNSAKEKNEWLAQAKEVLEQTFKALASDTLRDNAEHLLREAKEALSTLLAEVKGDWGKSKEEIGGLLQPLSEALGKLEKQITEMEKGRAAEYGSLKEQLKQVAETHEKLRETTSSLVQALRSPTARGRWGEMQLRRIVEMAGLQKHVDFEEQVGTDSGRPDLIVYLPKGGILAVDAKAPMDAFLKALEASDESERQVYVQRHVQSLLERVRELGKKRYWEGLEKAPDLVVMFVPSESCVGTAFEVNPSLFEESWRNNVVVATPTLLFALLKTVAWGWQQHEVAEEAKEIAEQALELFKRFATFNDHFRKIGERLAQAVDAYNDAAASARSRLLPLARQFAERVGKEFQEPPTLAQPTTVPNELLGPVRGEAEGEAPATSAF